MPICFCFKTKQKSLDYLENTSDRKSIKSDDNKQCYVNSFFVSEIDNKDVIEECVNDSLILQINNNDSNKKASDNLVNGQSAVCTRPNEVMVVSFFAIRKILSG
jgi:hypothetical protein